MDLRPIAAQMVGMKRPRQPKGIPVGGEFASKHNTEAASLLDGGDDSETMAMPATEDIIEEIYSRYPDPHWHTVDGPDGIVGDVAAVTYMGGDSINTPDGPLCLRVDVTFEVTEDPGTGMDTLTTTELYRVMDDDDVIDDRFDPHEHVSTSAMFPADSDTERQHNAYLAAVDYESSGLAG